MVKTPAQMAVEVEMKIKVNTDLLESTVDVIVPQIKKLLDLGLDSGSATAIILELMRAE